jgi:hypothetical protein
MWHIEAAIRHFVFFTRAECLLKIVYACECALKMFTQAEHALKMFVHAEHALKTFFMLSQHKYATLKNYKKLEAC